MHKRVARSGVHLSVERIIEHQEDVQRSLSEHLRFGGSYLPARLIGATPDEVLAERIFAQEESARQASMTMLAAIEAVLRLDYLHRCERKLRDPLSRALRERIYKAKGAEVRFEDILDTWQDSCPQFKSAISNLKAVMRYRNWLAHGRYWLPTLGQNYDFTSVGLISSALVNSLPLEGL